MSACLRWNAVWVPVQASFLVEHTPIGSDNSAYAQMLRAFCNSEDLASLIGRIYTSGQSQESLCEQDTHPWTDKLGLLPDTKCEHRDETYGNPD